MIIDKPASDCNFEYLTEHTEHKFKALQNSKFHKFLKSTVKQQVENCGTYLSFKLYQHSQNLDEFRRTLNSANFCNHRYCITCAWRRSRKLQLQTYATIRHLEEKNQKQYGFIFLTLTVPNCPMNDLNRTVKNMSKAFKKLQQREDWKKAVRGFVRGVEFIGDHTKEGEAHPHFHCLLMVDLWYFKSRYYLSQQRWRELWSDCYGMPNLQVRVERIKPKKKKDGTVLPAIVSAVFETLKYSVDLTDMNRLSDDDLRVLLKETKGIRQYNRGGMLKNLVDEIEKVDESVWIYLRDEFYKWTKDHYSEVNPMRNDLTE